MASMFDTSDTTWKVVGPNGEMQINGKGFPNGPNTLPEFFEDALNKGDGNKLLLIGEQVGENNSFTYNDVHNQALRLATSLLKQGVKKGDVVAVVSRSIPKVCILFIAVTWIGASVSLMWKDWNARDASTIAKSLGAKFLVVDSQQAKAVLPAKPGALMFLEANAGLMAMAAKMRVVVLEYDKLVAQTVPVSDLSKISIGEEEIAAIFYDNDTKAGMRFSHRALLTQVKSVIGARQRRGIPDPDVMLSALELADPSALIDDFLVTLHYNSTLVLPKFTGSGVVTHIVNKKVTELSCSVAQMLDITKAAMTSPNSLDSLACIRLTGNVTSEVASLESDTLQVWGQISAFGASGTVALFKAEEFMNREGGIVEEDFLMDMMVCNENDSGEMQPAPDNEDGIVLLKSPSFATSAVNNAQFPFCSVDGDHGWLKTNIKIRRENGIFKLA